MPSQPPKRNISAAPAAFNPPAVQPQPSTNAGRDFTERLRFAIARVDEHPMTPTAVRAMLSATYRFANPHATMENYPGNPRQHAINPERSALGGTTWNILLFNIGNTVRALQNAYRLDLVLAETPLNPPDARLAAKAALDDAVITLNARISRLETFAEVGPAGWRVRGSDGSGYWLATAEEDRLMKAQEGVVAHQVFTAQGEPSTPDLDNVNEV